MLEMKRVSKAYIYEHAEIYALREVTTTVEKGEFVAVTGPSGGGKTTLLTVAGLIESFNTGSYRFDGMDVGRLNDAERSRVRREKIGFIFQSYNLLPDLTVLENIEMPLRYRLIPRRDASRRSEEALERVGLRTQMNTHPFALSGGEQQRVAIARALAGSPHLILADEPTGNLDLAAAKDIANLLLGLHRDGATIMLITHHRDIAARAQRELHMFDGGLVGHPLVDGTKLV